MQELRVAILGCGGMGSYHARALSNLDEARVVGLVDPDPDRLRRFCERVPALAEVPAFEDSERLYAAMDVDGVVITSPHTLHHEQIIAAVGRGQHVLVEKPMACTANDAREIRSAAAAAGVTVLTAYQRRLDPCYRYMSEVIERGELGQIRSVTITCGQNWGRNTTTGWRQKPELSGGGMLMDSGSHIVDVFGWLSRGRPASVSAMVSDRGMPVDIDAVAQVAFDNGVWGQLTILGDVPFSWFESVVVTGTECVLRYENDPQHPWRTGHVARYVANEISHPLQLRGQETFAPRWLDAIAGRAENPVPPEAGVRVATLTEAIYESARRGSTVAVSA
ncbi:MAG TPA: Gfo/Idh/MocA family oxidoreductase [Candidatus Dormibacteraeota bacterium]|jgi:predicted dehydrogenase|nr:Gfo/Idh/MocA family oxidoreductase [Candidatus Dormibacteraeota bacterium]